MLIQERFKSPDKVFEKVYGIFDKRDYFNTLGLAKVQIRNFENFLKKGDKNAQALLDKFKGDKKKSHEYIIQVIHDRKKEQAFEDFKAFKSAVNKLELVSKGKSKEAYGASDLVKSRIHNNSQKYTIALYSAIRGKKFNNKKDVHADVDDLLAKNEGFSSDAQRKAAFANGYEEKDKKNEGKKRFKRQDGIGKAKYTISFHDGKKKHKDGSDFFDIKIFKNKKDLSDFVGTLVKQGYKLTRESVNEKINPKFYNARVQYTDPKNKKKFVGDVVRYDNGEYKVNLGKDGRFEKYILAKEKDLKIVSKSKKKTFESVNEDAPCWDTHKQVGMKTKGGKQVPNCVPKNEIKEDKNQIVQLKKKVGKSEIKFYDALSKIEKKLGKKNYRAFLEKGLSDFKINPKHYDYRGNGAAEEKLFQLAK